MVDERTLVIGKWYATPARIAHSARRRAIRREVGREKEKRGEISPLVMVYPVVGIGALRAPFMLFISLGLPLG